MGSWYLYVLECEGGKFYTGITVDVMRRFRRHAAGTGAAFTRINPPLRILAAAEFPDRPTVSRAELALKRLPKSEKRRWIEAHPWIASDTGARAAERSDG